VKHWGVGRVTLLGDAAHPITWDLGQGAGQAIEDAIVLARCVDLDADPVAALQAYEARRVPRTAMLAHQSRRIGSAASWQHPGAWRFRDLTFKLFWNVAMRRLTERLLIGYEA
jgi:2-polyprenyl-6-methoxyphenol hydroxylase-like FAD-dependent oxidoreductase